VEMFTSWKKVPVIFRKEKDVQKLMIRRKVFIKSRQILFHKQKHELF
jgi:hypothetical protein